MTKIVLSLITEITGNVKILDHICEPVFYEYLGEYFGGFVQDCSNSIDGTLELL